MHGRVSWNASLVEAEKMLHEIERAFATLGVPENQKVNLASYNLKGEALYWWEAYNRQITMSVLGDAATIPRIVTWELFVKGYNEQYCPAAYRMEQQNAFLYLKQGQSSVSECEAKFGLISICGTVDPYGYGSMPTF